MSLFACKFSFFSHITMDLCKNQPKVCSFHIICVLLPPTKSHLKYKSELQESMKFVSWNVNGLRACEGKGFSEIFRQLDADFFCLQETKMQEEIGRASCRERV